MKEFLRQKFLYPYFFGGFMSFVEKGETIRIDNMDFFINDCKPKAGIVNLNSVIKIEQGFS